MKSKAVSEAYPAVPLIFLAGLRGDRSPYHNTIGMAVTTLDENMKTVTEATLSKTGTKFYVNDSEISGEKAKPMLRIVHTVLKIVGNSGVRIQSRNYNIKSGSSASGAAALIQALDDLFELNLTINEKVSIIINASASSPRSLLGGISKIDVSQYPEVGGKQLLNPKELVGVSLFGFSFEKARIESEKIHRAMLASPQFEERVSNCNKRCHKIERRIIKKDFMGAFRVAQEDIDEAYALLLSQGIDIRNEEVKRVCDIVTDLRTSGVDAYYTMGGGSQIVVACRSKDREDVILAFEEYRISPTPYKLADGAKVV
ncbi:MAG: hypothetical protein J7K68_06035 [Candidatus Diapherotrites archaeon]|nr:hypothetical protein [Candidatus Diapherotrites archaeon]